MIIHHVLTFSQHFPRVFDLFILANVSSAKKIEGMEMKRLHLHVPDFELWVKTIPRISRCFRVRIR
jgi:hypothetical protein